MEKRDDIRTKITEGRVGPGLDAALTPLSILFGIVARTRAFLYSIGLLRALSVKTKVVSVGNISAGGTGKTPVTMHLARLFIERGKRPLILSRGYGGTVSGVGVVSDGRCLLMQAKDCGDEPRLMAARLLQDRVPVVVGPDRVRTGRFAVKEFSPDVIILDDGFQHMRLRRDIDIVLLSPVATRASELMLPRGLLREPYSALERADILLFKGGLPRSGPHGVAVTSDLPRFSFNYRPAALTGLEGDFKAGANTLRGKRVFLLAALASPCSFEETIESLGAIICGKAFFDDHHPYDGRDIRKLLEEAACADHIITTEKDAVKLLPYKDQLEKLLVLSVDVEMDSIEGFMDIIFKKLFDEEEDR